MKPNTQSPGHLPGIALVLACSIIVSSPLSADEHVKAAMGPADASAKVPAINYQSALPGTRNEYLKRTDAPRLPWQKLFKPNGDFAAESDDASAMHEMPMKHSASIPAMAEMTPTKSDGTDARGVIKSIDRESGKVKLKHGPIKRLDMPGMTMVFRVKDRALLDQVSKGDTVGFTVDVQGSTFYVTDFQK